ncbi:MAG: aminopeptidase [Ruminococcaceae bacterium]|nr:aminopeptidase [Oscillospiraceae bacterium]
MSDNKELREKLFYEQKNGYDLIGTDERIALEEFCEGYKVYLDNARTEREAVSEAIRLAEAEGFVPYTYGMEVKPGMKLYRSNRGKSLMLAVVGSKSLAEGCNIAAAHIDAPRLDLKQIPLHEDSEFAYFRTHYYGGIKKYQWLAVPLELHGVVTLKNGENVEIVIGKDPSDPQLVITDVLPHLAKDQLSKGAMDIIAAERMNILLGSIPYDDEGSDRVKLAVMSLLNDTYGITEEDFLSAEIQAVPSYPTRDVGLDRSFVGGYGHDDRVCAYCELKAILDLDKPEHTAVCILADKEEIGSEGTSGMQSQAFECFMEDLCDAQGVALRHCFANSFCLSADVCNAYDPMFAEISEKRSNAKCNYGMGILKFTGKAGKGGTNDADAETVGKLRRIFDDNNVVWQMGALGKVDQGGGGTVALFMSRRNIATIDAGVPVLSMHAPFELVSKFDTYMTYKGVKAIYED